MADCNHDDAEFDWGEAQPSMDHVQIPGWCPTCETGLRRYYSFDKQVEETPEDRAAMAEIMAERNLDERRERHFDRHGHF